MLVNLDDDIGYRETEAELARLEAELRDLYTVAARDMQEKSFDYMESLLDAAEEVRKRAESGIISVSEYRRWLTTHILTAERFQQMADVLAFDLLQTNMIASSIMNGHMPEVYAINMNYMTYVIEKLTKVNTSFTLYNRQAVERIVRDHPDLLPVANVDTAKDLRWSKQHINSAVAQGILQGEPITDIAARLRMVSDMDLRASIRNARTMTTSAQNGGRMDAMERVQKMGAKVQKMWVATLDKRTRHWHRQMDGQKRALNDYFDSDIGRIKFPGDQNAAPANVYNCRCAIITEDVEFPHDASDLSLRHSDGLEGMGYKEWKHEHDGNVKVPPNPDNPSYGYAPHTEKND
jgi:hypothetical protein